MAINYNRINVVKYLIEEEFKYQNYKGIYKINIRIQNDYALNQSCAKGYFEMTQYLVKKYEVLNINTELIYGIAMVQAHIHNHKDIANYLTKFSPNKNYLAN